MHSDHDVATKTGLESPEHHAGQIAELAHQLWCLRGCPLGSADEDWFAAVEQLREERDSAAVRAASSASGSVQS